MRALLPGDSERRFLRVETLVPTTSWRLEQLAPLDGAVVSQGFLVEASATDAGGVTKVDLYIDDTLIETAAAAPYQFTAPPLAAGTHVVKVRAYDSTGNGLTESRRSSVEAEGVVPQASVKSGKSVTVVPNPYRGYASIRQRPSAWDLTPNAADPTGTHIDFYGLPPGRWTLRIYTISGDLVQEIHSDDPVNLSIRPPVTSGETTLPGYNRQQDNPNDGQARWDLISRNGQDVVSGVYLFTVDSSEGIQRGKFVVIR